MSTRQNHVGANASSGANGYEIAGVAGGTFNPTILQNNGNVRWGSAGTLLAQTAGTKGTVWVGSNTANQLAQKKASINGSVLTVNTNADQAGGSQNFMLPGGWVFLSNALWSSSTVSFTSGINSTYNNYCFIIKHARPTTDGITIGMQTTVNGSTWVTSGYQWGLFGTKCAAGTITSYYGYNNSATFMDILGTGLSNSSLNNSFSATINLINPSGSEYPTFNWQSNGFTHNGANQEWYTNSGSSVNPVAAAITGVRFITSSGNMTTGLVSLFGQTKPS